MRILRIPYTKAAYDRLRMMHDPEILPLPFDADALSPFSVKFNGTNPITKGMRLLYRDKTIGVVGDHDHRGVEVHLIAPPSEQVDRAVAHVFDTVRAHLDRVNKILNAESRARRGSDLHNQKLAREAEIAALQRERHLARIDQSTTQMMQGKMAAAVGFERADQNDRSPVILNGVTKEDIQAARALTADRQKITFRFKSHYNAEPKLEVMTSKHITWTFSWKNDHYVMDQDWSGNPRPDERKVITEIRDMIARNARITADDRITHALAAVPATELSVERYSLSDLTVPTVCKPDTNLDLGETAKVSFAGNLIHLHVEEVKIATWKVEKGNTDVRHILSLQYWDVLEFDAFRSPDLLSRLGGSWLEAVTRTINVDDADFRRFDVEDLEADISTMDFGYGG